MRCKYKHIGILFFGIGIMLIALGILKISPDYKIKKEHHQVVVKTIKVTNKLVDMPEIDHSSNFSGFTQSTFRILFINKPYYVNIILGNKFIKEKCFFKNCIFTDIVGNLSGMAGIVFNGQDDLQVNITYLKEHRHDSQVWIFFREEPVGNIRTVWFRNDVLKNTMNWTWGYRLDSDIFFPYQILLTKNQRKPRDYSSIFKRKTRMAAWIVSNCKAKSLRDEYVSALVKEGVEVDIFGKCSKNKTRVDGSSIEEMISTRYKFYLSFENNFCKDYVSEKFFSYLSFDTVLIVRGGLNYSRHFDSNAYIDASLFETVHALAKYMITVGNNATLYTKYLEAKDKYKVNGSPGYNRMMSHCRLCEHMNNREMYQKTYEDIASYLENGTCFNPNKIVLQ